MIAINQCDKRQAVFLNNKTKLFWVAPFQDRSAYVKRVRPIPEADQAGADVEITIDSVDTGERRQFGSYIARRVMVTRKVVPSPGANTRAATDESDGWYIDLPGLGCRESRSGVTVGFVAGAPGKRDRLQVKRLGTASRGYAVEETTLRTEAGRTTISKVELIEFSEATLDSSLFELPAGYSQALRTARGGFDMTKPDTLGNRLQSHWAELTASAQRWFR